MVQAKSVGFGNGSIVFHPKIEAKPEKTTSTNKTGNVIINNITAAVAERPAHFEVTFMLNADFEHDGLEMSNVFHWTCAVLEPSHHAQYRAVEDKAARLIAPMFRALADKIESELKTFDEIASSEKDS